MRTAGQKVNGKVGPMGLNPAFEAVRTKSRAGASMTFLGVIKWYGGINKSTGRKNDYGFIARPNGEDIYFHRSNIVDLTMPLTEGTRVTFTLEHNSAGRCFANHVLSVDAYEPYERDALSPNKAVQTFAFQNLAHKLGADAYVDFLAVHLDWLSKTALDYASRAVPAHHFLGIGRKALRFELPVWARYRIYASCTDLVPYLNEVIDFLCSQQTDDDSENLGWLDCELTQSRERFWANHAFGKCHEELATFALPDLKRKIWVRCVFPKIQLNERVKELEARREILSADDWRLVTGEVLRSVNEHFESQAALRIIPLNVRIEAFAHQGENLDKFREVVVSTLGEMARQESGAAYLASFWKNQTPSSPSHWLFPHAPLEVRKNTFRAYYKNLLEALAEPFSLENGVKEWRPDDTCTMLSDDDEKLASLWAGRNAQKDGYLAMMLSARIAEKCVAQLYRSLGYSVTDTALQQLENKSQSWITHDLDVEGYGPIDVKNARRPINSHTFYVEHIVKSFKKDINNRSVRIAGVLSPYLQLKFIRSPKYAQFEIPPIVYLGETSLSDIAKLAASFSSTCLEVQPVRDPLQTIAPWYFSYPSLLDTPKVVQELGKFEWPTDAHWAYLLDKANVHAYLPALLLSGRPLPRPFHRLLHQWESDFYAQLQMRRDKHFSIPTLFLSVLAFVLEQLRTSPENAGTGNFTVSAIRRFLYVETTSRKDQNRNPLGLIDPTGLISNLIDTLDVLWQHRERTILHHFVRFRLRGLGILQGQCADLAQWETIVAYCGGRAIETDEMGNVIRSSENTPKYIGKCGKFPLVLGREVMCDSCQKLVCPDCGFCSDSCSGKQINRVEAKAQQ